jgi:glutamyl/glutaminyl-tRNA synthetase
MLSSPRLAVFDMEKLRWVNQQRIKTIPVPDLVELVKDQLLWEGIVKEGTDKSDLNFVNFAFATTIAWPSK